MRVDNQLYSIEQSMTALLAVGVNHESAPISVREKLAFTPDLLPQALRHIRSDLPVSEAAILSTCNRTELYLHADQPIYEPIARWLSDYHQLPLSDLSSHLYQHPDAHAVRHMMRVASGLDSMVLGEPQILGQVKDAYHHATNAGTVGKTLSRLFQKTFNVAKTVRTDTDIGRNPISVAFAAVSLAKQVFGQLNQSQALLIGAGETIELTARHLREQSIGSMTIANRTIQRAHDIAETVDATAMELSAIQRQLELVDVVIASTAAPNLLITKAMVEEAQRKRQHRPILFIDLAVPRDVDPTIDDLSDTFVYAVDDLRMIIDDNIRSRQSAAKLAETIIEQHTDEFLVWLKRQSQVQLIQKLRGHSQMVTDDLVARAKRQIADGADPAEIIDKLGNSLQHQLMHGPTECLKSAITDQDESAIKRLLNAYPKLNH